MVTNSPLLKALLKLWNDRIDYDLITILMCDLWFLVGLMAGMLIGVGVRW